MRPVRTAFLLLAALAATALGGAPALARTLVVLGDSYSIPVHFGTRDWPLLLRDAGLVGPVADFAASGAAASRGRRHTFADQIALWERAGRPRLDRERLSALDEQQAPGSEPGGPEGAQAPHPEEPDYG